jgi:hypothetical protein
MAAEPNDLDALLSDLKSLYGDRRKEAVNKLGDLPQSSQRVVEALIVVQNTDYRDDVRQAAAHALQSPVHQEFLRQNPGLLNTLAAAVTTHPSGYGQSSGFGQSSGYGQSYASVMQMPMSWQDIWKLAVQPSVDNYERIIADPDATTGRAYKWIFFTILVSYPIAVIISVAGVLIQRGRLNLIFQAVLNGLPTIVLYTVLVSVGAMLGLLIGGYVLDWSARLIGGVGERTKYMFALAAFTCPMTLLSFALVTLTGVPLFSSLLGIYTFILQLTAIRAVYKLGWGGSCLATLVVPIIIVVVIFVLSLLFRG